METLKQCNKCKEIKSLDDFRKRTRKGYAKEYYESWCKKCKSKNNAEYAKKHPEQNRESKRKWYANNPIEAKSRHLMNNYGISIQEYKQMWVKQNGCCAICGIYQFELDKALCVDHCHISGRNRGLLCGSCNIGIGRFKDNPDLLLSGSVYLKNYQS